MLLLQKFAVLVYLKKRKSELIKSNRLELWAVEMATVEINDNNDKIYQSLPYQNFSNISQIIC